MKRTKFNISLIILILTYSVAFCQEKKTIIQKHEDKQLIKYFNQSELLSKNETNNLSIRIYTLDNYPGSADFESGEITHNLLIAISEYDEYPNQGLFEIGPFYNPRKINWIKNNFELLYGDLKKPNKKKFDVTIDDIIEIK